MKPREIITETARLAAERGWTEDSPHEQYLLKLFYLREDARHGIENGLRSLQADLNRLGKIIISPGPLLNTLGELQQRPAAIEAAVGAFATADKALRDYLATFPAREES